VHVPLTPIRALYRAADLYARKTGVVSGGRRFGYAEFGERVERLACGLLSEGVLTGDRVAYLSFNTHQLLEGYFAAPLIRAIVMPLNVRLTAAELAGILNHAEPRIVVYEPDFASLVKHVRQDCPSVRRWVESGEPYEELLARGRIQRPDLFTFDEREIAELFYTSGSNGTPKGVTLSHRTLYLHMLSIPATFYNDETTVELRTIPLFHANGWGGPQCATFHGLKQVMVRRYDAAHPAVPECAVVPAPGPQWGEVPAAFVVLKPGYTLLESALRDFLRQRIAKFKIPRRFQFGDTALPKTGTGKIVKRALRETLWSGKEARIQG
jgi:fatty-acyl-CoA synthase